MQPGGRLVLVEDDELLRRALANALQRAGHEVDACASAAEAKRAMKTRFDAAVIDVVLPDGSGLELAQRAVSQVPAPCVVAISGADCAEETFALGRAGVCHFLRKPFRPEELREMLTGAGGNSQRLDRAVRRPLGNCDCRGAHFLEGRLLGLWKPVDRLRGAARFAVGSMGLREAQAEVRVQMFREALNSSSGNRSEAARVLMVTRQAIHRFLREHELL